MEDLIRNYRWEPVRVTFAVAAQQLSAEDVKRLRDERNLPEFQHAQVGDYQVHHPFRPINFTGNGFCWSKNWLESIATETGSTTFGRPIYKVAVETSGLRLSETIDVQIGDQTVQYPAGGEVVRLVEGSLYLWGSDSKWEARLSWVTSPSS